MRHTFFTKPAAWKAAGKFIDSEGNSSRAVGETKVVHLEDVWEIRGRMKILGEAPAEYENVYQVRPMDPGKGHTTWTAANPVLGRLDGVFSVVGPVILSSYRSSNGKYLGVEAMNLVEDGSYLVSGSLFVNGTRASAWEITLRAEEEPSGEK